MRLADVAGKPKGGSPITTLTLKACIVVRTWSISTLPRTGRISCEWLILPTCEPEKALCTPLSLRMCSLAALSAGTCPIRCELQALPLQALNQAVACAKETTGLIHHSYHGSQYVSIVYNQRLAARKIVASTGTVDACYDNALAENVNDAYKNKLIHNRTWDDVVDVEIATFEWVTRWNEARLHQGLGYRTPAEVESESCKTDAGQEIIEIKANA